MIKQNSLDTNGLYALSGGEPLEGMMSAEQIARVFSNVRKPLAEVPDSFLQYAPKELAVPELINRFRKKTRSYEKEQLFDAIQSFDSDLARSFIREMAVMIKQEDILSSDIVKASETSSIINAACVLRVEGIKPLYLQWLKWIQNRTDTANLKNTMLRGFLEMTLVTRGLEFYDQSIDNALGEFVKSLPRGWIMGVLLAASNGDRDVLERFKLNFSIKDVNQILNMSPLTTSSANRGYPALGAPVFGYLSSSEQDKLLPIYLKIVLPNYNPSRNLNEEWLDSRKDWYIHQTGKKFQSLEPSCRSSDDFVDFLISLQRFGKSGSDLMKHLFQWHYLDESLYRAIRAQNTDKEYWREQIQNREEPLEDAEFERGLTLWCMGDSNMAQQYEPWIYSNINQSKRSKVYDALKYLPEKDLLQTINKVKDKLSQENWAQLAIPLSKHKGKECALLLLQIYDKQASASGRISIGQSLNRIANKNFGLRRQEMFEWIQTLSL